MEIKNIAENLINNAKGQLKSFGITGPTLFVIQGGQITPIDISINDLEIINDLTSYLISDEIEALLLIIPKSKKYALNCEETNYLLVLLYAKDINLARYIYYTKTENNIKIADLGWSKKAKPDTSFSNPFNSK